MDCLYRYQIVNCGDSYRVELTSLPIHRRTAKGAWLYDGRFVLLTARKKYACETIETARESFLARTAKWRGILSCRLKMIDEALRDLDVNGWSDERKKPEKDEVFPWFLPPD